MKPSIQSSWFTHATKGMVNKFFLKEAQGLEHVPGSGPFILAANHISVPDSWVLGLALIKRYNREVRFISHDDIWWGKWFTSKVSPTLGLLLVDWRSPSNVLKEAKKVLENNWVVGIHPEGVRNQDTFALCLGKTGVARLALETGVLVVPAGYFGPPIATLWDVVREFVFKRNRSKIIFGKPMDFSGYKERPITKELLYRVTDMVMIEIGKLANKKPRLHTNT
jgi:1-acyl-sn-glycerol-3-phosphate acyltransferase